MRIGGSPSRPWTPIQVLPVDHAQVLAEQKAELQELRATTTASTTATTIRTGPQLVDSSGRPVWNETVVPPRWAA